MWHRATNLLASATFVASLSTLGCAAIVGLEDTEPCASNAYCEGFFGLGSTCGEDGYCSQPPSCTTSAECRERHGAGASCESSTCVLAPLDPRCTLSEPEELLDEWPGELGDRFLLGGLFPIDTEKHHVRADAARLAIREINEIATGIGGRQLALLICNNDSDGDSANAEQETEELTRYLAGSLGAPVVLGPTTSADSLAAVHSLLQDQLATALISPSATSPQLTDVPDRLDSSDPYGLLWRTCPSDALQGLVIAQLVAGVIPPEVPPDLDRVTVLYQNDAYGTGLQQVFSDTFMAISAEHDVRAISFEEDLSDLGAAIATAVAHAPDAVVVVSNNAAHSVNVLELSQSEQALQSASYFLTDGSKDAAVLLSNTNSAAVDQVVINAIGTAPASRDSFVNDAFVTAFQNQFGIDAGQFSYAAHSYDAAYIAAYGIAHAQHTTENFDGLHVADGLSRLSFGEAHLVGPNEFHSVVSALTTMNGGVDIEGASGALDFDAYVGEAPGDIEIWSVCDPNAESCPTAPIEGAKYVFVTEIVIPGEDF